MTGRNSVPGGSPRAAPGVTTYETLQRLPLEGLEHLDLLIADEAHYVKNPEARRTAALTALAQKAERVLYLTGTPLENRVEEMCFLLSTLSPETAAKARELSDMAGAEPFRQAIAPVYLRRRREDVLTELPELTEVEDWCEQTPAEAEVYRQAVQAGSFMAMRQAGWSSTDTGKARRLLELCEDAEEDGRRVLIFTFFRDTMAQVRRLLGDRCPGEIHGGVSPEERQRILDEFAHSPAGTALCCQVTAGGVGLNIQAASLVIFCEPQLKPSTETQAISRAYRMDRPGRCWCTGCSPRTRWTRPSPHCCGRNRRSLMNMPTVLPPAMPRPAPNRSGSPGRSPRNRHGWGWSRTGIPFQLIRHIEIPRSFCVPGDFFDAEFSTRGRGKSGKLPGIEPSAAGSGKKRKFPSCNSAEKLL